MEYDNTNKGVLFLNKNKKQPNHPDYTGNLNVDGEDFSLAGWTKTSKNGTKFLSVSISPPYNGGEKKQMNNIAEKAKQTDDGLPF